MIQSCLHTINITMEMTMPMGRIGEDWTDCLWVLECELAEGNVVVVVNGDDG